jgi:hypothetical protein
MFVTEAVWKMFRDNMEKYGRDIHSMDPLVCHTAGCGTRHKYTNIQIYSVKYYKHFIKNNIIKSYLHIKKFVYREK